jgi:xanthine dehydrogenase YagR molybdenum-binding subunit
MPEYKWPAPEDRDLIGKRTSRLDGPAKVTGAAKYSYDVKRPGMLYARELRSPYAHAKITKLDTAAAAQMPGVKAIRVIQPVGTEIQWALDEIAVVAATSEQAAEDAVRAIQIEYEVLPHFVTAEQLDKATGAWRANSRLSASLTRPRLRPKPSAAAITAFLRLPLLHGVPWASLSGPMTRT